MSGNDKLGVVLLIHTGSEYPIPKKFPDTGTLEWNQCAHYRKFLKVEGEYITKDEKPQKEKELLLWGEYEARSKFERIKGTLDEGSKLPHYIHTPLACTFAYDGPKSGCALNTDPHVFGENFIYSKCLQNRKNGETQLKQLATGSVILMGARTKSGQDYQFHIDTVFVIKNSIPFSVLESGAGKGLKEVKEKYGKTLFWQLTIEPLLREIFLPLEKRKSCGRGHCSPSHICEGTDFVLYEGATFEDREKFNGMFSFFPCKPFNTSKNGFERPIITKDKLPGFGKWPAQGFALEEKNDDEIRTIWEKVCRIVQKEKCYLGVKAEEPKATADQ